VVEQFSVQASGVKHTEVSSGSKSLSKEGGKTANTFTDRRGNNDPCRATHKGLCQSNG